MSHADWFQKEKSFLRQYARAVTSDQLIGDEIVAAALANFDPGTISARDDNQRRVALFRTFYAKWRGAYEATDQAEAFSNDALLASVSPSTDLSRQIVLLVDVVGISVSLAAELLETEPPTARNLLAEERKRINEENVSGSALIIEDEPVIAMDIGSTLTSIGLTVVDAARTAKSAVSLALSHKPDIIMADYDLGSGGTGLDALREISSEHSAIVIFLTAHPDHVLAGEDYEPTFVLTKPFDERALRAAIVHGMSIPRTQIIS